MAVISHLEGQPGLFFVPANAVVRFLVPSPVHCQQVTRAPVATSWLATFRCRIKTEVGNMKRAHQSHERLQCLLMKTSRETGRIRKQAPPSHHGGKGTEGETVSPPLNKNKTTMDDGQASVARPELVTTAECRTFNEKACLSLRLGKADTELVLIKVGLAVACAGPCPHAG